MKALVVQRSNLEIAQMPLMRERFLVGRSPHCDLVARAPGIGPVHFLVEWIGEGAFDPKNGIWTIYDLTRANGKGDDRLLEGIVLSEEESFEYGGLTIKIIDGNLLESADFKGGISKSLEEVKKGGGEKALLEVVLMRTDSKVIEKISYIPRARNGKHKEHLDSDYADLHFKWKDRQLALDQRLPDNCQLMKGAELVKPGGGGMDMVSLRDEDFWTIRTPSFNVFLRFVPKIKVVQIPKEEKVDPGFWFKYWTIVIGGVLFVLSIYYLIYRTSDTVPDPPPRIAQIEVVDYVPPPAPEPIPEPAEKVKEAPLPEERKLPNKTKEKAESAPFVKKSDKPGSAAPPQPKKEKSVSDVGLNSPAPVKNINAVGLLGAIGQKAGEGRVSADQIMNQTTTTEAADSGTGRIAIHSPQAGALGIGKKGAKIGSGGRDGFQGASTTVSGDRTFSKGSTGPIARAGGSGNGFGLGLGNASGSGVGGGTSLGELSAGGLTVSGGLDKETVRRVISQYKRQIKACYDGQLLLQPTLEGRIRVDWVISPNGHVQTAQSTANTTRSSPLESCLLGVVRAMKFPEAPNGRQTRVIYPWQFTK
jgi:hypothetical protein